VSAQQTCLNLDRLCARYGWEMAKACCEAWGRNNAENHITKSLGVLQEDGVYAFFLYQNSRAKKEKKDHQAQGESGVARALSAAAHALLQAAEIPAFKGAFTDIANSLQAIRGDNTSTGLADDLDSLLLAKRLLEQALIYARYHAKGLEGE